jgi:hypothetical protein
MNTNKACIVSVCGIYMSLSSKYAEVIEYRYIGHNSYKVITDKTSQFFSDIDRAIEYAKEYTNNE